MGLSEELKWRGLIKDKTFASPSWLDKKGTFYHGIDGSADSLHIGNLAALMMAMRLVNGGWKAILLVGGATSLVGDPGVKTEERRLAPKDVIAKNVAAIEKQIEKLFTGQKISVVNNIDWLGNVRLLDFLRDIGKHYSVTELTQRDFVSERMKDAGISYAEFSYTLIQGYDFWHLFKNHGVKLQIGGSDQWGNMLSGVALVRKKESAQVHALSMPLVINKSSGKKFGKTEEGAVWLDASKTSPTEFYQFWMNVDDVDAADYLKIFTLLPRAEIESIIKKHQSDPASRIPQTALAQQVTEFVHGREETHTAEVVTNVLTGKTSIGVVSEGIIKQVRKEIPSVKLPKDAGLVQALVAAGLAGSNTEARRLLANKSVYLNGKRVDKENFEKSDFQNGRLILRRGKAFKDSALIEIS